MNLLNDTFIKAHGLNARRIRLHQKRILQALCNEINIDISIQNTCTISDRSILPWDIATENLGKEASDYQIWQKNHVVSCIPAAGAASRFFLELQNFVNFIDKLIEGPPHLNSSKEIESRDIFAQFSFINQLNRHIEKQKFEDIKNQAPAFSQKLLSYFNKENEEDSSLIFAYGVSCALIENYSLKPKLIVPATLEGDSFLKLKIEEQVNLFSCLGNVLVVPNKLKKEMQNILYRLKPKEYEKWLLLEQDHTLSTIRFHRNGMPFVDTQGEYSVVSAGHGELLHLFDKISDHFPQAHCLHIRNIDNIIGNKSEQKFEFSIPSKLFYNLRSLLELLRQKIPLLNFNSATEINDIKLSNHLLFISRLIGLSQEISEIKNNPVVTCKKLYHILAKLFHWQAIAENTLNSQIWKLILENCERPLSVFSVVKKQKGDVGGGPVFAKISDGSVVKLCMEMPHASTEDTKEYFSDTGKATHFNPALVFFELRTHTTPATNIGKKVNFVQLFDERFWLLSKREHKGFPVCYHETVLYELIGNSATTNLVFIEVPRSLFKPHKSYLDCLEQDRKSYGFNKDIESG